MKISWLVIETDRTVEVVPDFGREHLLESETECWCAPRVEHYDRDLVVHELEQ